MVKNHLNRRHFHPSCNHLVSEQFLKSTSAQNCAIHGNNIHKQSSLNTYSTIIKPLKSEGIKCNVRYAARI